jgi:hypothetical protein
MKKIILLFALISCSFVGNSQILISLLLGDKLNSDKLEFGMDGGLTLSNIAGSKGQYLRTFNLGFYFDLSIKNKPHLSFTTGLMVKSNLGADNLSTYSLNDVRLDTIFGSGTNTRKLTYFNLPVMFKYKFKHNFYAEGGLQAGLRTKALDTFKQTIDKEDDTQHTHGIKDNTTMLDAGLTVGLGYRLLSGNGMNLGMRYYHGMVDVVKNDGTLMQYNRAIYFNVGIPIGKTPDKTK